MEQGRDALEPDKADTVEVVDGEEERAEAMEKDSDPDKPNNKKKDQFRILYVSLTWRMKKMEHCGAEI